MEIFPGDNVDCDDALAKLSKSGFIERYEVSGEKFIQIANWAKHQNPHCKESPSEIPAPGQHQTSPVQEPDKNETSTAVAVLIPDSLNPYPDSGFPSTTPPTPFGVVGPSADADGVAVVTPEKKTKPTPRNKNYAIAALELAPDVGEAFERCWNAWPTQGWDFRSKRAQPRRINRALASARFDGICKHIQLQTSDGHRLCPSDLADATLAWIGSKRKETFRQYGGDVPPCVPCIGNFFSADPTSKKHWQEALLEFFNPAQEAS